MEKQKPGKKPRSLLQKTRLFIGVVSGIVAIATTAYFGTDYLTAWQLQAKSAELPGARLYSVQELHHTQAYSWYTSYPKIDEPVFDGAVAKVANDAKGAFLARVDLDAPTNQPMNDLNVSYVVDKTTNESLLVHVTVRQAFGKKYKEYAKSVSFDRNSRRLVVSDTKPEDGREVRVEKGDETDSDIDCGEEKCIALTFDGGPSYITPPLLDTLKAAKAKATFFELGAQAALYPTVARRTASEGHGIGNGTYDHRNLLTLSSAEVRKELDRGADAIHAATGKWPVVARAPYGAITDEVAKQTDMPFVEWSIDSEDWKTAQAEDIYQKVMSQAKPGAIVAAHDIYQPTADAFRRIIPDLVEQGYELVSVSELLGLKDRPVGIYKSR